MIVHDFTVFVDVGHPITIMLYGNYNEPQGPYLPMHREFLRT